MLKSQYCYIISRSANGQNRELGAPFSLLEAPQLKAKFDTASNAIQLKAIIPIIYSKLP